MTVLAAGAFAIVLAVAAFTLLRVLEDALVDDVRSANEQALEVQAMRLIAGGVPEGADMVLTSAGAAYELPAAGTRSVIAFAPDEQTFSALPLPADGTTTSSLPADVMFERALPPAGAQALGIAGRPDDFAVASLRVGGVVLATATSLDNVADTIDTTRTIAVVDRAGARRARGGAGVAARRPGAASRPRRDVAGRLDRVAVAARARARAGLRATRSPSWRRR